MESSKAKVSHVQENDRKTALDFSADTLQPRGERNDIFNILKGEAPQPIFQKGRSDKDFLRQNKNMRVYHPQTIQQESKGLE
jgi:hypothetical protein